MSAVKKLQGELASCITFYINGEWTMEQMLHSIQSEIMASTEIGANQRGDMLRDLKKKIGTTIVAEMLRYLPTN